MWSLLPEQTDARRAFEIMAVDFSGGLSSPVEIAVDGPSGVEAWVTGDQAVARTVSSGDAVLKETLESGERELRLVAAQAAIASPAEEFEVRRVR